MRIYVPIYWNIESDEDACVCDVIYHVLGVLLDPRIHEERIMTWTSSGRYKDIQDRKLENQGHDKKASFAIENATRFVDDHRIYTYKEAAHDGW